MTVSTIKLETIKDIKKFINTVSRFDFEADIIQGRYVIDAKSIMGIFSLDLSEELVLHIYSENCEDFLEAIDSFVIKN